MFYSKARKRWPMSTQILLWFVGTALFNTIIGILSFRSDLRMSMIYAQSVGLSICTCSVLARLLIKPVGLVRSVVVQGPAMVVGAVIGYAIAITVCGDSFLNWIQETKPDTVFKLISISVFLGILIAHFFLSREKLAENNKQIQKERIRRLSSDKLALEANLKRLQAQVEPHFLFNTLSNVVSLMDTDPATARTMLMDLIRYLRTTLSRTRNTETTLGQEMDFLRAYLDIFKIRMGKRLQYRIDLPEKLVHHPLPPMLLQPIVENALLHGLEPKIDGGRITITVFARSAMIIIEISDTGAGMVDVASSGVGLANVRERISQLYGDLGRLVVKDALPHGVTVMVQVPLQACSVSSG